MLKLAKRKFNKQPLFLDQVQSERLERTRVPSKMTLDELETKAQSDVQLFLRTGTSSDTPCCGHELFRRALELQQEPAWDALMRTYGGLVSRWVRTHPSYFSSGEEVEYFANRVFERMWRSIATKDGKFAKFPNLKSILRFAKMCVHSVVIDDGPNRPPADTTHVDVDTLDEHNAPGVLIDLSASHSNELCKLIDQYLKSDAERIVIYGYFLYDMKNREIFAAHSEHFTSVKQLSNLRLNVLRRLARVPAFEDMLRALTADDDPFFKAGLVC